MSRAVAAVVVAGMALTSVSARLQHVHAYQGHDHGDHAHGPAIHVHVADAHAHDADGRHDGLRLEACDPAAHAVTSGVVCAVTTAAFAPASAPPVADVLAQPPLAWRVSTPRDVRAHSPPRVTDAPLRAPPLFRPA